MMQTAIEADGEGSVARRIWLGSLVGLAVGVLCWRGNQSPHRLGAPAGGRAAGSGQIEGGRRMRLWSVHPRYLDARGLVALWREALLAQAVLRGRTTGYLHHPQLHRFRAQPAPCGAIAEYLRGVHAEAAGRGYAFTAGKISRAHGLETIAVTRGQLRHEWNHLLAKLAIRDPAWRRRLESVRRPRPHPLFRIVAGDVEAWEKGLPSRSTLGSSGRSIERPAAGPER